MPLHDHFHLPLSVQRPWKGYYAAWSTTIAFFNRGTLPAKHFVMPLLQADLFEVQVLRNFGGPQLRAAIELISASNKDRTAARRSSRPNAPATSTAVCP